MIINSLLKKYLTVGIILLFVGSAIIPSTAQNIEKPSLPTSRGHWLYVGGSGPGNYTKIQDAIGNATIGDTIYVYNDSSPYVENIVINTSIDLIGEDKDTTIINGSGVNNNETISTVYITANNVSVRRFTIQNDNLSGITILSKNNSITDNIISNSLKYGVFLMSSNNVISDNSFICDGSGINVLNGENTGITGNVISQTKIGVMVTNSMNVDISRNIISQNYAGVFIIGSYNIVVYQNNISHNKKIGIYTMLTSDNKIIQNNFIGNNISAESVQASLMLLIYKHKIGISFPIRRNVWDGNYWERARLLPYVFQGWVKYYIDWHPARKPYNIGG